MEYNKKYRDLDEHGKRAVDSILTIEHDRALTTKAIKRKPRMVKIDYYNAPAFAGTGNFLTSELAEEIYIPATPEAELADYVIPVSVNSMEPTYHGGKKVLVVKCDTIDIGEIGIFVINGEAYIKELGERCLISHNASDKPIPFRHDDSIDCCGKVIGIVEK